MLDRHYRQLKRQPLTIIEEYNLDFIDGSALKYLLRHKYKNGIEDINKMMFYVERLKFKRNKYNINKDVIDSIIKDNSFNHGLYFELLAYILHYEDLTLKQINKNYLLLINE